MKSNEKDLNVGMSDALKKKQAEDQIKEDERKSKLLGSGSAKQAADAIINRKKQMAEVEEGM